MKHLTYTCPDCYGEGQDHGVDGAFTCKTCKGMGKILQHQFNKIKNQNQK